MTRTRYTPGLFLQPACKRSQVCSLDHVAFQRLSKCTVPILVPSIMHRLRWVVHLNIRCIVAQPMYAKCLVAWDVPVFSTEAAPKVCLIAQLQITYAFHVQTSAGGVSTNNARSDQAVCRSRSLPLSRLAGAGKRQTGSQSVGLAGVGSTTLLQASLTAHCTAPGDDHSHSALCCY